MLEKLTRRQRFYGAIIIIVLLLALTVKLLVFAETGQINPEKPGDNPNIEKIGNMYAHHMPSQGVTCYSYKHPSVNPETECIKHDTTEEIQQ